MQMLLKFQLRPQSAKKYFSVSDFTKKYFYQSLDYLQIKIYQI